MQRAPCMQRVGPVQYPWAAQHAGLQGTLGLIFVIPNLGHQFTESDTVNLIHVHVQVYFSSHIRLLIAF